ncbi:MAG: hypothetical protein M1839_001264 [Geoglossum umbratile]|nr:MAG: hypothetical protein M1839_001264 [Geoglossum umbratile]
MAPTLAKAPLVLAAILALEFAIPANGAEVVVLDRRSLSLRQSNDCATNPAWQSNVQAWVAADTDPKLKIWWQNVTSRPHNSFANELGKQFGSHLNDFKCGIGSYSTCVAQGCSDYQMAGDPPWVYLATLAVVHLNSFFNAMVTGVTNGQADYLGLIDDMILRFFPWKSQRFVLGSAQFWIVAAITALAALVSFGSLAVGTSLAGIGAFAGAAVQQAALNMAPSSGSTAADLGTFASMTGSRVRENFNKWANSTFTGDPDARNQTILYESPPLTSQTHLRILVFWGLPPNDRKVNVQRLLPRDYLQGGGYIGDNIPSNTKIEEFYMKQMVSRTINSEWRTKRIFIYFARTDDPEDSNGPEVTKYYSKADGGVYYLYRYSEDGILQGHLDKPWGLEFLNGSTVSVLSKPQPKGMDGGRKARSLIRRDGSNYKIPPSDITKASARAWRKAGFNYTDMIAQERILESIASNGTLTPFEDGAGWEGVWTIPVCDVGNHTKWNVKYGWKQNHRYDMLPCCCGENCKDTAKFIRAANLNGLQTVLRGCKIQLQGSGINFDSVDYGFRWKNSLPLAFASWGNGARFGFVIVILIPVLVGFCCCGK